MVLPRHGHTSLFHVSSAPTLGPRQGPRSGVRHSARLAPVPKGDGADVQYELPSVSKYRKVINGGAGTTFHSPSPVRQRHRFDSPPTLTALAFKTSPLPEPSLYKYRRSPAVRVMPQSTPSRPSSPMSFSSSGRASPTSLSMARPLSSPNLFTPLAMHRAPDGLARPSTSDEAGLSRAATVEKELFALQPDPVAAATTELAPTALDERLETAASSADALSAPATEAPGEPLPFATAPDAEPTTAHAGMAAAPAPSSEEAIAAPSTAPLAGWAEPKSAEAPDVSAPAGSEAALAGSESHEDAVATEAAAVTEA